MTKSEKKTQDNTMAYVNKMFFMMKQRIFLTERKENRFNNTELRLLAEVLTARYEGKRLISTQIADLIGVTRSAVSQIVNRLESAGIVKRVADDVDRKIAYIEMTENALSLYEKDLEELQQFVNAVVSRYGKQKFEQLYKLYGEFILCVEEESGSLQQGSKKRSNKKKK